MSTHHAQPIQLANYIFAEVGQAIVFRLIA
jgi:hypothetical protein